MAQAWGCLCKYVWWLCKFQNPFWICKYMSLVLLPFSFGHFIEPPVVSFRTVDQLLCSVYSSYMTVLFEVVHAYDGDMVWFSCSKFIWPLICVSWASRLQLWDDNRPSLFWLTAVDVRQWCWRNGAITCLRTDKHIYGCLHQFVLKKEIYIYKKTEGVVKCC